MGMLDALTGFGQLATVVSGGNPAVLAVTAGLKAIDAIVDSEDEDEAKKKRTAEYMHMAADLSRLAASIIDGLADGEITAEEHAAIIKELEALHFGG